MNTSKRIMEKLLSATCPFSGPDAGEDFSSPSLGFHSLFRAIPSGFEPPISCVTGRRFKPTKLRDHDDGFPRRAVPSNRLRNYTIYSRHNPPEKPLKKFGDKLDILVRIELGCRYHHRPSKVKKTVSVRVFYQNLLTRSVASPRLLCEEM